MQIMPGAVICHRAQALLVDRLAGWAIDFLLHLLRQGIRVETGLATEEGDLADLGALGVSQASPPQVTRPAGTLGRTELHRLITANRNMRAIAIERLAGGTGTGMILLIIAKVLVAKRLASPEELLPFLAGPGPVFVGIHKTGITFTHLMIRNRRRNLARLQLFEISLRMETTVRSDPGFGEDLLLTNENEVLCHTLHQGQQQVMLLGDAEGLCRHNDLMLAIHRGHAVIALNDPMRGLHLGALVIGEVAFERLPGLPDLIVIFGQPALEFLDLAAERPAILFFLGRKVRGNTTGIPFAMNLEHALYRPLQLLLLFLQFGFGATPFLAGIRGQLAAINGKQLLANQPQLITVEQHIPKDRLDLSGHGRDKMGYGGEVRLGVRRERHEDHILPAGTLYLAAAKNAAGIGIEHNLQ